MNVIDPSNKIPSADRTESQKVKNKEESKISRASKEKIKGHEAEDVNSRPLLKRQSSMPDLKGKTANAKEEIKMKSGLLWECVNRKPNKEGGYVYIFKMKEEKLNDPQLFYEMVPAIEYDASDTMEKLPDSTKKKTAESFKKLIGRHGVEDFETQYQNYHMKEFRQLGYQIHSDNNGSFLQMPDREALLANWEKLREKNPNLPPLSIHSSEGIADDMTFAEAYITHDILLSSGAEFVHDQLAHVRPTLLIMLESADQKDPQAYKKLRFQLVKEIVKSYRQIQITKSLIEKEGKHPIQIPKRLQEHLEKIEGALGAAADITAAPFSGMNNSNVPSLLGAWDEYNTVWEKRWGDKTINNEEMTSVLEDLQKVEQEFTSLYKKSTQR